MKGVPKTQNFIFCLLKEGEKGKEILFPKWVIQVAGGGNGAKLEGCVVKGTLSPKSLSMMECLLQKLTRFLTSCNNQDIDPGVWFCFFCDQSENV